MGSNRREPGQLSVDAAQISPSRPAECTNALTPLAPAPVKQPKSVRAVIPTLARVWAREGKVSISGLCHVLLFYGLDQTDLPNIPSGSLALQILTDESTASGALNKSPFVKTRDGIRYFLSDDPVFHSEVGEQHRDQCLATFAQLHLPLATPIRLKSGSYSVADLLAESIARFSFEQQEPAWTAIAYAEYMPPKTDWVNRFRERASFSEMVNHLLSLDFRSQSCAGTHVFQALVRIDQADQRTPILDPQTRNKLDSYLKTTLNKVQQRQRADGSWDSDWYAVAYDSNTQPTSLQSHILVTGHLLEVLDSLDTRRGLPAAVSLRAAEWCVKALNTADVPHDGSLLCPFTHAARAARTILSEPLDQAVNYHPKVEH